MPQVGVRTINGVDTEVHADAHGMFRIMLEGKALGSGNNLDTAIAQARNEINRSKTAVNVEFITKTGGEKGVATGMHSRNRTIMASIGGGKKEQLDYNYRAFSAVMPKNKLDRWFEIQAQLKALKEEASLLERGYEIRLRERVEEAINEAQKKTLGGITAAAAARRTGAKRRR